MLLPIKWMKDYLPIDESAQRIAHRLSQTGSHVEEIIDWSESLDHIVSAKVLKIEKHPEADRLYLVTIDFGQEPITIVTGADNMKEGDMVCYAKTGAIMPSGLEIKPVKLKGIPSEGMLCSYEELGYAEHLVPKGSQKGIIILSPEVEVGQDIREVLQNEDEILDIEITPNRPDCLSILGMSRETAAAFDQKIQWPSTKVDKEIDEISAYFEGIQLKTKDCSRYVARVCTDIQVKESPQWLQNYLMQAGMRPVNNIVDITNFVMLETGQPIHAFDIQQLPERKIVVRNGKNGEKMETLDGKVRELSKEDTIISDGEKAIAIAGIMGGKNSEVEESTQTILIESAHFNSSAVRKTSKKLNLRTEASQRFEKGANVHLAKFAADRVCYLIHALGAGKVVRGEYDEFPEIRSKAQITVNPEIFTNILGTEIKKDEAIHYLELLEFEVDDQGENIRVTVPHHRDDVRISEDLVEEVGRLYGFYRIEPKALVGSIHRGIKSPRRRTVDQAKALLYGLKFTEIMTYSFLSKKSYDLLNMEIPEDIITIENPLGEDFSVMRTDLLSNLLSIMDRNASNHIDHVSFYEIGNTFHNENGEYVEKLKLALGNYGEDFYGLKARIETFFKEMGLKNISYEKEENHPSFHPGRCATIYLDQEEIGVMGEISYDIQDKFHFSKRVYMAQLDMEKIIDHAQFDREYEKIIRYPEIRRDIALMVPKDYPSSKIEEVIYKQSPWIRDVQLFDIYEGKHVDENHRSMAYNIIYQDENRTLKDDEVSAVQEKLISALDEIGVKLRQ
ncbi:MAG: phenylalanine--tRNA ligase subunit beta [Tissierellia bacterium]|nr:phenylalanine--tRNA ligase subunit beta [Tissierellia bacterium]